MTKTACYRAATLAKAGKNLFLEDHEIGISNVDDLNRQLNWRRDTGMCPPRSSMSNKAQRVEELKNAAKRYNIA